MDSDPLMHAENFNRLDTSHVLGLAVACLNGDGVKAQMGSGVENRNKDVDWLPKSGTLECGFSHEPSGEVWIFFS